MPAPLSQGYPAPLGSQPYGPPPGGEAWDHGDLSPQDDMRREVLNLERCGPEAQAVYARTRSVAWIAGVSPERGAARRRRRRRRPPHPPPRCYPPPF